jgi:class 3 adenylate cyclase
MSVQSAVLLIADIGGYTRFMKFHAASLVHAQEIVGQLLESVIAAATPALRLAKIEGDAAFFYAPMGKRPSDWLAERTDAIYGAFHARLADITQNNLCPCDGCMQAGQLRIKMVSHAGDVVTHRTAGSTELAGVDVILVHRLLKNDVPLPEYLLVTEPVYGLLDAQRRGTAAALPIDVPDLGPTATWYLALTAKEAPLRNARLPVLKRLARHVRRIGRTLPYLAGRREPPCAGFRNIPDAPPAATGHSSGEERQGEGR